MCRTILALSAVVALLSVTSPPARAWLPNGSPVCTAPEIQSGLVGIPASWNAIITTFSSHETVWEDRRDVATSGTDLYLGSIDALGSIEYPICTAPFDQTQPSLAQVEVPCGLQGGCRDIAVAWQDGRGAGGEDIFANLAYRPWATDGVPVCRMPGTQQTPAIAPSDDVLGFVMEAVVAWVDDRAGATGIYAQRLDAAGERMWDSSGVLVSPGGVSSSVWWPRIVKGAVPGRVLLSWVDHRDFPAAPTLFVQSLERSGERTAGWPEGGLRVATLGSPQQHRLLPGGFVVWNELRDSGHRLRATQVLPAGVFAPGWGDSGVAVTPVIREFTLADAVVDLAGWYGSGGLLVSWLDVVERSITYTPSIALKVQRLTSAGVPAPGWPADGTVVTGYPATLGGGALAAQVDGGAIVTWTGPDAGDGGVFAQRLLGDGSLHASWPATGALLCSVAGAQYGPVIASVESGALVAWMDERGGLGTDVYAQHVTSTGIAGLAAVDGAPVSMLRLGPPAPNPARGAVSMALELPHDGPVSAVVLDVAGRHVRTLVQGARGAGRHTLGWDGRDESGLATPPGLYLVRVSTPAGEAHTRVVRLD